VQKLNLTDEQIKKLFELFAAQIHEAETDAARQGIEMGFDNAKAEFEKYLSCQGVNTNGKRDNT